MTFNISSVKGQLYRDTIMFFKSSFLVIIYRHNSGTEGEIMTIFHMCLDTELMTLIFYNKSLVNKLLQSLNCIYYMFEQTWIETATLYFLLWQVQCTVFLLKSWLVKRINII